MLEENATPDKTKAELFAENPDRFEDLEKVLMVVKRNEDGQLMILNQVSTVEELWIVKGAVEQNVNIRVAVAQQKQQIMKPKIVTGNGKGIINAVRNGFRK